MLPFVIQNFLLSNSNGREPACYIVHPVVVCYSGLSRENTLDHEVDHVAPSTDETLHHADDYDDLHQQNGGFGVSRRTQCFNITQYMVLGVAGGVPSDYSTHASAWKYQWTGFHTRYLLFRKRIGSMY